MSRDIQALVLVALGTAGLAASATGNYSAYVKPSLLPYLVAACVALIVLAVSPYFGSAGRDAAGGHGADDAGATADGHDHGTRVTWLLLLPTLVLMLIAPPALGAAAAGRDTGVLSATDLQLSRLPPIPAADPADLSLLDVAMRSGFDDVGGLAGRAVRVAGFVEPAEDGGWYLSRISIACCAADALAVKVEVRGAAPPPADTWVEVIGTIETTSADRPPILNAGTVRTIPEPDMPYLLRG